MTPTKFFFFLKNKIQFYSKIIMHLIIHHREVKNIRNSEQTWKAGPVSAEFIILQPPMKPKRNNLLRITSVGGSSTKLSKFFTHGGDSSTFFFNLLFKLIFVFLLCTKLAINIFSKAASIDSSLLSCPEYCCNRKFLDPQISSSEASGLIPRRR